jgi:hyaluronate lyase
LKKRISKAFHLLLTLAIISVVLVSPGSKPADAASPYDALRAKWKDYLTGGASYNVNDPDIISRISDIDDNANQVRGTLQTGTNRTNCNCLWTDLASTSNPNHITQSYSRIRSMALAYSTYGSSIQGTDRTTLKAQIVDVFDWMHDNRYSKYLPDGVTLRTTYGTWWDWQIGTPLWVNDIMVLMFADLSATQKVEAIEAIDYFSPDQAGTTYEYVGANRVWRSLVHAIRGIVGETSAKMVLARDGLSDLSDGHVGDLNVFDQVNSGEGQYEDGSYVFHGIYAYNGGYGRTLFTDVSSIMYILQGTSWEVTDPKSSIMWNMFYNGYEPLLYKDLMMDMVRGRDIARSVAPDIHAGRLLLSGYILTSQFAPAQHALAIKKSIKYNIQNDSGYYSEASIWSIIKAKGIMTDSSITARPELVMNKIYPNMARAVQLRPGFGLGLSMYSNKIGTYEGFTSENFKAWYSGYGMTYLYNNDVNQYGDNFWPTVNPYRLPGTTVDTIARVTHDTSNNAELSSSDWTGGVSDGLYGAAGMELLHPTAWTTGTTNVTLSLSAKKSWFMFDDEIVALGAGISSTDGRTIETTIDNRRINASGSNALTVNTTGTTKPTSLPWSETMSNVNWIHLAGNVSGSDVGYYFPGGTATIKGLREARTGKWSDITANSAFIPPGNPSFTRNYLNLWFDHGVSPTNSTFSYVLLPGKTAQQVSSYAATPNITILENSTGAQAVKENNLNMTGINFWNNAVKTSANVTSNMKSSVLLKETAQDLNVSVADPTRANAGTIDITINKSATAVLSADPEVTVVSLSPQIQLKVNTAGSLGKSFHAAFSFTAPIAPPSAPIITGITQGSGQLAMKWSNTEGATSYKVYYGTSSGSMAQSVATTGPLNSLTLTGLTNGTTYYISVTAVNGQGEGGKSDQWEAVPRTEIIVDNGSAVFAPSALDWTISSFSSERYGADYAHDGSTGSNSAVAAKSATYSTALTAGTYNLYGFWNDGDNRATNAPFDIMTSTGTTTISVNEHFNGGQWNLLGTYTFSGGSLPRVKIRNNGANGYVIADAIKFATVTPAPHESASLFSQNFESGSTSAWTFTGPGTWSVVNDESKMLEQSDQNQTQFATAVGGGSPLNVSNLSFETKVKLVSYNTSSVSSFVTLLARYTDDNNKYTFAYSPGQSKLHISKRVGGVLTLLAEKPFQLSVGETHILKVVVNDNLLEFYVDGEKQLTAIDSGPPLSTGQVGIAVVMTKVRFDDIAVQP